MEERLTAECSVANGVTAETMTVEFVDPRVLATGTIANLHLGRDVGEIELIERAESRERTPRATLDKQIVRDISNPKTKQI